MARSKKETIEALKSLVEDVRRLGGDRAAAAVRAAADDVEGGRWYDITEFIVRRITTGYVDSRDVDNVVHGGSDELENLSESLNLVDGSGSELQIKELRADIEYHNLTGEQERYWARFKKTGPREWGMVGEPRLGEE